MRPGAILSAAKIGLAVLLAQSFPAAAAELKVLSAAAMVPVLSELSLQFERTTAHKLMVSFDVVGVLRQQIAAGETFDVAILTASAINDLIKDGKIVADTRTDIARSGLGVIIRTGAPKHDISSADTFKQTLLNAQSIAYTKGTPSAAHLETLFDRLGIAEQMKSKSKVHQETGATEQAVAAGEAELGFMTLSIILNMPGAELLGPLPPELQNYVVYTGGVATSAQHPEAAKTLIQFLTSNSAVPVIRAKHMELGPR
jgi:molybdate transport system substrate-binding protein